MNLKYVRRLLFLLNNLDFVVERIAFNRNSSRTFN